MLEANRVSPHPLTNIPIHHPPLSKVKLTFQPQILVESSPYLVLSLDFRPQFCH